mgnify:FL=1
MLASDFAGQIVAEVSLKSMKIRYLKVRRVVNGKRKTLKLIRSVSIYIHGGSRIFLHNPKDYWSWRRSE